MHDESEASVRDDAHEGAQPATAAAVAETPPPPAPPTTAVASGPGAPSPRRRGAMWWGLGLVFVGVALLLDQFVPRFDLWRLWPLIIVAVGIVTMFGHSGAKWSVRTLADGLSTIAVGLVFLGQTLGYIPWDAWFNIFRLWPLILVAVGLDVLGRGLHNNWVRALGDVVVIAGLAFGALVMTPAGPGYTWLGSATEVKTFDRVEAHMPAIEEGKARIEGGFGVFDLAAGDNLVAATGKSPLNPRFEVSAEGRRADVNVGFDAGAWGSGSDSRMEVTLDRAVLWNLVVNTGVSSADVDLRGLKIARLDYSAGVSESTLTLGNSADSGDGAIPVKIESGVSKVTLRVPEGDRARVRVSSGLTDTKTHGNWKATGEGDSRTYESADFSDSGTFWDVRIQSGIGGIVVEYY